MINSWKKMRFISAALLVILLFSVLMACGKSDTSSSTPAPSGEAPKTEESAKLTNEEIYNYQETDRDQWLVEKAKEEGKVTVYASLNVKDAAPLFEAFEEKYGIKVVLWRAGSEKVVQRTITEASAQRYEVDLIETNGPELEILYREKLLAPFYSPFFSDLPPEAIPEHKHWVADRFNFFVMAYNTDLIKPEEAPKTYEDLLNPRWKGKLSMESSDVDWFGSVVKSMGEEKGLEYFRQIKQQEPSFRTGHTLIAELVASGELPITLTAYNHRAEKLKKDGAPIEWLPLQPAFGRPNGVALAKNAPHPYAALLLADFILSPEGQQIFNDRGRVPASNKVESPLNDFQYKMIDPIVVLDEWEKWNKIWSDLYFNGQPAPTEGEDK